MSEAEDAQKTKIGANILKRAKELRDEAQRLEVEAGRPLPEKWELGMRVRFLRHKEWAWGAGSEATVVKLSDNCKNMKGHEYQVFWTEPDGGGAMWWTTPDDVELAPPNPCSVKAVKEPAL